MAPSTYYGTVRPAHRASSWKQTRLLDNVWVQLGILALGSFLAFWLNLGGYPLFDVDEPRYAQAAYEMLKRGDWITPYFNGVVRFDKPVFFYWLIAGVYKLLGVSEFAARSISACSATLMVFGVYGLGAKMVGPRYGFLAGLVLMSSVMMVGLAHMSITDMNLALWMTLTTISLFLVAQSDRRWWLAAALFSGIGILTKGPVAIVLPGAVLVLYSTLTGQFKKCLLTPWFLVAVLVALILPLPWYFAAYDANGQVFLDAFYNHNVSRFSGAVNYHIKPFWYYVPILLVGFLPWMAFLPAAIRTAWRWGRFQFTLRERSPLVSLLIYSAVWAVTVFIFFTVAKTKLLTYILPMFPALALFMGGAAHVLTQTHDHRIAGIIETERPLWQMSGWVLVALKLVALVVLLFIMDAVIPPEAIHLVANPLLYGFVALLMLGISLAMGLLAHQRATAAVVTIATTVSLVSGGLWMTLVPQVNQLTQGDMLAFVQLSGNASKHGRLGIYEITRPSLTFYTHQPIPHIARQDHEAMAHMVSRSNVDAPVYLITKNKLVDDLIAHLPEGAEHSLVQRGQVYALLAIDGAPAQPEQPPNPPTDAPIYSDINTDVSATSASSQAAYAQVKQEATKTKHLSPSSLPVSNRPLGNVSAETKSPSASTANRPTQNQSQDPQTVQNHSLRSFAQTAKSTSAPFTESLPAKLTPSPVTAEATQPKSTE